MVKNLLKKIINFIFPPTCYICKTNLLDEDGLCSKCLDDLSFITRPFCNVCGYPFELQECETLNSCLCAKCISKYHKFDKLRSVVCYDETSKKLILPLKHNDQTRFAKFIAKLMINVGYDLIKESDYIIPIPIHFTRLLKRKYNQSTLIANIIAKKKIIKKFYILY